MAAYPIKGAQRVRRRQGASRSPASPSATTAPSSSRSTEPLADLPEAARDAGRRDRPDSTPAELRRASDRHRPVEASSSGSTTTTCSFARNADVLGRPRRRPTRSSRAHHRRAEHRGRRVRERQRRRAEIPRGRDARLGGRRRAEARLLTSRRRSSSVRRRSTPRADRSRTCACGRRSTTPSTSTAIIEQLIGGRGTRRRRRDPAGARRLRHDARAVPVRPDEGEAAARRRRPPERYRRRALDLADADLACASPRRCRATSPNVGIRAKIVQRERAAAREAARKGETDLSLKDWFADYPDAENFLYPLLHSANKGVGRQRVVLREPAFDSLVHAARREPDDDEARRAVHAGRLPRLRRRADDVPLLLQRARTPCSRGSSGFQLPVDLQRPALDAT